MRSTGDRELGRMPMTAPPADMHPPTRHPNPSAPRFVVDDSRQPPARPTALRRLTSESLLAGGTEIEIEHGGAVYRLRLTSLGKLILTK